MRMRVETREGVLVVYDAASPSAEDEEGCSGYIGYWLSARDNKQYVFGATLYDESDLSTILLALERDLGVDLETLADSDDRIEGALRASAEAPNEEILWEPATLHRALEIMGFDAEDERARVDEPNDGGVAAPCEPCAAGPGPPSNCASPGGLAEEALSVVADCCGDGGGGGGGGGPLDCCEWAVASAAEGLVSSPDGTRTVAACCWCPPCPPTCDDNNACTTGDYCVMSCDGAYCVNEPRICNDDNKCTNDSCNPGTGCVFAPKNCNDGDPCTADTCWPDIGCPHNPRCSVGKKCCPAGTNYFCCGVGEDICCPTDPAYADHCCPSERPTCCGAGCCNPDQKCCNGVCGTKGACCKFDTGSCSEETSLCCTQQGGTFLGGGTTCTPADLCRPFCENCHQLTATFNECAHEAGDDVCSPIECFRNVLDTATCDMFAHRKGPSKCDTFDTGVRGALQQHWVWVQSPDVCIPTWTGGMRPWEMIWAGCGRDCNPTLFRVRCDAPSCDGVAYRVELAGTIRLCGCSDP